MDDLAGFLRTRRSRVAPSSVGILTDSRRRVAGLRREDHRLGVTAGHRLTGLLYDRSPRGLYADGETPTLDAVGHLRLAAGKYPGGPGREPLVLSAEDGLRLLGTFGGADRHGAGSAALDPHAA
jgi:hypothetical protein